MIRFRLPSHCFFQTFFWINILPLIAHPGLIPVSKVLAHTFNQCKFSGEYSCLKADFVFKRESCKYIMQWLIPTALLTFISFASFWMKPKKCSRIKLLAIILGLLYLHIMYINKESPKVSYPTAKDCWLHTCLMFVLAAFVEYGIVIIVQKLNKQSNRQQNGKSDPEEEGVVRVCFVFKPD